MQRLAGDELLRDLPFERDAGGTMLGHGFHPLKAQHQWSIQTLHPVHPEGRTPIRGQHSTPIDTHGRRMSARVRSARSPAGPYNKKSSFRYIQRPDAEKN